MEAPPPRLRRVEIEIGGMRTVHCVRAVFQALAGVPGVRQADVSMGRASLELDGELDRAALTAALHQLGYDLNAASPPVRPLPTL